MQLCFRFADQVRNHSWWGGFNSYPKTLVDFFWCAQIYLDEKKNLFVFDSIELPFPSFLDLYGKNRSVEMIPLLLAVTVFTDVISFCLELLQFC